LHGGTQGPWGVHWYMYMGRYTDQGFRSRIQETLYSATVYCED